MNKITNSRVFALSKRDSNVDRVIGIKTIPKTGKENPGLNSIFYVKYKNMKGYFEEIVEELCERDPRYKQEAYEFVMEALSFTQKKYKRSKHVSGEELVEGIRELLLEKFGPMTITVLNHWGVKSTVDFGNMVFNLVQYKILSRTEEDSIESFRGRYDFKKVFSEEYKDILNKKVSRIKSF